MASVTALVKNAILAIAWALSKPSYRADGLGYEMKFWPWRLFVQHSADCEIANQGVCLQRLHRWAHGHLQRAKYRLKRGHTCKSPSKEQWSRVEDSPVVG